MGVAAAPGAVYTVLALLAAIENVIPPVPSDAAVALGAFLTNRGLTTPLGVFLVTWIANLAGAAAVYLISRRYGRTALRDQSRARRLLAPRHWQSSSANISVSASPAYSSAVFCPGSARSCRHSPVWFISSPVRTLVPMALASAIWYGSITMLGSVHRGGMGADQPRSFWE